MLSCPQHPCPSLRRHAARSRRHLPGASVQRPTRIWLILLLLQNHQDDSCKHRHGALDGAFWISSCGKSTQHGNYLPFIGPHTQNSHCQSLLDEIINSINFLAEKALSSVETSLLNAPPQQIGFGKPPNAAVVGNSKAKRKRKQPTPSPPPFKEDAPEPTAEQIEEQASAEIASGTHQLETLLCTSIDRNFDKFELYVMRNILCVKPEDRDWLRLGHYEGLNFDNLPPSVLEDGLVGDSDKMDVPEVDNPDVPTVYSVNKLRKRLQASQKLNTMLIAEKARNDALLNELRNLVGRTVDRGASAVEREEDTDEKAHLAFLLNKGDLSQADAATPLTTTTAFSLSQMQALRALSTSLSSVLPDLKPHNGTVGPDAEVEDSGALRKRTWRKERVEYVEGATRRHLETVRGLELGRNGEVRDGEWQGEGRQFAGGEVGALENVVHVLEGGGGGQEDEPGESDAMEDEKKA